MFAVCDMLDHGALDKAGNITAFGKDTGLY
jgi:hypothetical protein